MATTGSQLTRTIRLQVDGGNVVVQEIRNVATQGERQLQQMATSAEDSMRRFGRATRNAVGGIALQLQDVAVQLQSGQNPLIILTQQGSQIASVFGPGGIVAGAFLAMGGLLANLAFGFEDVNREGKTTLELFEDLLKTVPRTAEEMEKLVTQVRGLSPRSREAGTVALTSELNRLDEERKRLTAQIAEAARPILEQMAEGRQIYQTTLAQAYLAPDDRAVAQQRLKMLEEQAAAIERVVAQEKGALIELQGLMKLESNAGFAAQVEEFSKQAADAIVDIDTLLKKQSALSEQLKVLRGEVPAAEGGDPRAKREAEQRDRKLNEELARAMQERLRAQLDLQEQAGELTKDQRAQMEVIADLERQQLDLTDARVAKMLEEARVRGQLLKAADAAKEAEKLSGFLRTLEGKVLESEGRLGKEVGKPLSRAQEIARTIAEIMAEAKRVAGDAALVMEERVAVLAGRLVDAKRAIEVEPKIADLARRAAEAQRELAEKRGTLTRGEAVRARETERLAAAGLGEEDLARPDVQEALDALARAEQGMRALEEAKRAGEVVAQSHARRLEAENALLLAQGKITRDAVAQQQARQQLVQQGIAATSQAGKEILANAAAAEKARAALEAWNKEEQQRQSLAQLTERRVQQEERIAVLLRQQTQAQVDAAKAQRELVADKIAPDSAIGRARLAEQARLSELEKREKEILEQQRRAEEIGQGLGEGLARGFERAIFQAENLTDVMRELGEEMARLLLRMLLLEPLARSIGSAVTGYLQPTPGTAPPPRAYVQGYGTPLARGGVIADGLLQAFASGGIVRRPKLFPLADGGVGLMGEGGPEAILPLRRGTGGRLGVEASAARPVLNVSVQTIDQRRAGAPVETDVQQQADGSVTIRQVVRDLVANGLARGEYDASFRRRYGVVPAAR